MVKLLDEAEVAEDDDEEEGEETREETGTEPGSGGDPKKPRRKKVLRSTYEPDVRSDAWLKVKVDYLEGIGDSLDLVPIGAWHGSGRKNQFWSPILLACWDDESQTYSAVTKVMSGFSDDFCESPRSSRQSIL